MPSKIYLAPEAPTVWADSGGDKLLDLRSLASGAVAAGAYLDLGASPRADEYEIEVFIDGWNDGALGTAPDGQPIFLYVATSNDGVNWTGVPTTAPTASAEGTYTPEQLHNLTFACELRHFSLDPADGIRGRAVIRLTARYVAPVVHNFTSRRFNDNGSHTITLRAIPMEGQ